MVENSAAPLRNPVQHDKIPGRADVKVDEDCEESFMFDEVAKAPREVEEDPKTPRQVDAADCRQTSRKPRRISKRLWTRFLR